MFREERVKPFFHRGDLIGAAHREADDKCFVLGQQTATEQNVNGIVRGQVDSAMEEVESRNVVAWILDKLDRERDFLPLRTHRRQIFLWPRAACGLVPRKRDVPIFPRDFAAHRECDLVTPSYRTPLASSNLNSAAHSLRCSSFTKGSGSRLRRVQLVSACSVW